MARKPPRRGVVRSSAHMASILSKEFSYPVTQCNLSSWKRGVKVPAGMPPFPLPDINGTGWRSKAKGCAWFKKWLASRKNGHSDKPELTIKSDEAEMQSKIDRAAMRRIELEREQRHMDKNYLLWADALHWSQQIGEELYAMWNTFEDEFPVKLAALPEKSIEEFQRLCRESVAGFKAALADKAKANR